ncbi:hypothetical protein [Chondrinema litorale]|uniref:hypothetical protein n=1 Tax=Chondrinema litorale TaxID=2994555 RepID=UPI002542CCC3|nr:hypothetical protein [Chondrinema litorale]UZR94308.1 hypothetical protein OQ292_00565 [Chondrinema litorale]
MNQLKNNFTTILACSFFLLLFSCDSDEYPTENYMHLYINGYEWEAFQFQVTSTQNSNGEVEIAIIATAELNEAVIIGIQGFPDEIQSRTQEITSLANGDFLGYREEGNATGIETHSSFGCTTIDGSIFIDEYNTDEGYISGTFGGTVCSTGAQDVVTFSSGEFLRISLDQ